MRSRLADLGIMIAAFALASVIAGLAGSPDLGTAFAFGQMGFALALVFVLLRR